MAVESLNPGPADDSTSLETPQKQRLGLFRKLKDGIRSSGAKVVDTVGKSLTSMDAILVPPALADEFPGALLCSLCSHVPEFAVHALVFRSMQTVRPALKTGM